MMCSTHLDFKTGYWGLETGCGDSCLYCAQLWSVFQIIQPDVLVVLLDLGFSGMSSLFSVGLPTLAGYAVITWSFMGNLPRQVAYSFDVISLFSVNNSRPFQILLSFILLPWLLSSDISLPFMLFESNF